MAGTDLGTIDAYREADSPRCAGSTGVIAAQVPWAEKTLEKFFDRLGDDRCAEITLVSADAAEWISNVGADRRRNVGPGLDPLHIVQWATRALDEVRRGVRNAARRNGQKAAARELKRARYALWKNPEDLFRLPAVE